MARNDKRVQVTLECQACKRRNYITTKNKINDRERIEIKKYCRWDRRTRLTRRPAERGAERLRAVAPPRTRRRWPRRRDRRPRAVREQVTDVALGWSDPR